MRVLTFSLGFGPKLLKIDARRHRVLHQRHSARRLREDGRARRLTTRAPGASDEFLSKSKWQRFQILIAGPLMNLLLAVVLMTFVIWNGATEPAFEQRTPVVGRVLPGSPAEKAGIKRAT